MRVLILVMLNGQQLLLSELGKRTADSIDDIAGLRVALGTGLRTAVLLDPQTMEPLPDEILVNASAVAMAQLGKISRVVPADSPIAMPEGAVVLP